MEHIWARIGELRRNLAERKLDAMVLIDAEKLGWVNAFYYSGYQGTSATVVITHDRAILATDSRYTLQASETSPLELQTQKTGENHAVTVKRLVGELGLKRCGFDGAALSASTFIQLSELPVQWEDCSSMITAQRRHKDAGEIALIRRAADIAAGAYLAALKTVRPGMKEAELAKIIELEIAKLDGEGVWHDGGMIVASGVRSALPHGRASKKTMQLGEQVTVDYGSIYGAYQSDITRNFSLGPVADAEFLKIHDVLLEAHNTAAAALKPGVIGRDIDAIARNIIARAGYGQYFGHGLGHSFGLEIHENPRLSPAYGEELREGDVITVEPGIYIPGRGGLRLEDDYLITASGAERLSSALPQEFIHLNL